jgi:hypothetical protein
VIPVTFLNGLIMVTPSLLSRLIGIFNLPILIRSHANVFPTENDANRMQFAYPLRVDPEFPGQANVIDVFFPPHVS